MNFSHNISVSPPNQEAQEKSVTKMIIVMALGLIINYINGTVIHTFRKHQIFYLNPRYILFIHLVINDMIQLTTSISLVMMINTVYRINIMLCCLILSFTMFTTFNTPLNIALMAVECYIAVCFPLRHAELCTIRWACVLIGCIWAVNVSSTLLDIFLLTATEPERLAYDNALHCEYNNLFRHPVSQKKREVSYIVYLVCVWLTILYTYVRIFLVARAAKTLKSSTGDMTKARNTVLLHGFQVLLCMQTYVFHLIIRGLVSLFPRYVSEIVFVMYIFVHIFPRLISPIVYGLRDKTFRHYLMTHFLCAETQDEF